MDDLYEPVKGDGARTRRMKRRAAEEKSAGSKQKKRLKASNTIKNSKKVINSTGRKDESCRGRSSATKDGDGYAPSSVPRGNRPSGLDELDVPKTAGGTDNATRGNVVNTASVDRITSFLRDNNVSEDVASKLAACLRKDGPLGNNTEVNNSGVRSSTAGEEQGSEDDDDEDECERDRYEVGDEDVAGDEREEEFFEDVVDEAGQLARRQTDASDEELDLSVTLERETNGRSSIIEVENEVEGADGVCGGDTALRDVPSVSSRPDAQPVRRPDHNTSNMCAPSDETILAHVVEKATDVINERVNKAVDELYRKVSTDLERIHKMGDYMRDLTNVVTTAARVMFIKQGSSVPRQKEIHNKICLLPALFTDSFIMQIVSRCLLGTAWKE